MEKLESVLRAEDDARDAINEAHARAKALLDEARGRAAEIHVASLAEAKTRAEAERATTRDAARAEAEKIVSVALSDRTSVLESATGRIDSAVVAVMKELVG